MRLIDETPRAGAGGTRIAFLHPASTLGVLDRVEGTRHAKGPALVTLGDVELISLSDGTFRLDGGAMFGVVPKPLWQRRAPADDRNRIALGLRPLLVRTGGQLVLIDAGIGDKMAPKDIEIYGIDRQSHLDHSLAAAGCTADDIAVVIASHLHFDHAGGFTTVQRRPSGAAIPARDVLRAARRMGRRDAPA